MIVRTASTLRAIVFGTCVVAAALPVTAAEATPASGEPAPAGQTAAPKPPPEPPLRRWFELQQFTAATRYRYIENSLAVTLSNHLQYKDSIRGRFNADPQKRYTLNIGIASGSNFIGSWDNYGVGTGGPANHDQAIKQLYGSAAPVKGVELQYGGLYVNRGENDEFTTYDDDGYVVGERASLRRPNDLYFDEISVTRGMIGPYETPDLSKRWKGLVHPNYWQVLVDKRFSRAIAGSLDYTTQSGADTIRAAVTLRLPARAPVQTLRYEQYNRVTMHPAAGFGIWVDRPMAKHLRLQGGYVTVDEFYGPTDTATRAREWNADRIQRGRRLFAIATIPIRGPLSVSVFATRAFDSPYTVPVRTRFDLIVQYDVLDSLRRTGIF